MTNNDPVDELDAALRRWAQEVPPGERTEHLVVTLLDHKDTARGTHRYTARQGDALAGALINARSCAGDASTIASLLRPWQPARGEEAGAQLSLAALRPIPAGGELGAQISPQPRIAPIARDQIADLARYVDLSLARRAVDDFFLREAKFPLASLVEVVPTADRAAAGQTGVVADITPLLPGTNDHSEEVRFVYRVRLNVSGASDPKEFAEDQLRLPSGRS